MFRVFRNDTGRCVLCGTYRQCVYWVGSDSDFYSIA